jgi:allophanate hydrolase
MSISSSPMIKVAVVGAHLTGQPLNFQLTDEQAILVRACKTKPIYKLYALEGALPKPALIRQADGTGGAIEVEVWEISPIGFGRFVNLIPPPLGIGNLVLEDDEVVKGFICEPYATVDAPDITHLGGWRAYLAQRSV